MGAADPTLIAGSLTEDQAAEVVDHAVDADDTIVDPHVMHEVLAMTRTTILRPSVSPLASTYGVSPSVPPIALPSYPPPPTRAVTDNGTQIGLVAAALTAAAVFVGVIATPQLMVRRDHTWVTPAFLAQQDIHVVEIAQGLDKARLEKVALDEEMHHITARLRELDEHESPADVEAALTTELMKRRAEQKQLLSTIDDRDRQLIPPSRELGTKLKATEKQIKELKAARKGLADSSALIAEKQELTAKAAQVVLSLKANDEHRKALDASPYRTAVDGDAMLAWIPEENLEHVHEGAVLKSCRWGTFACTDVGMVTQVFGEYVEHANPLTGDRTRGCYVQVTWTEDSATKRQMLFSR